MQYELAITSTESALKAAQTASGVKDRIAQHWITKIVQKKKELVATRLTNQETRDPRLNQRTLKGSEREDIKNPILEEIHDELRTWLHQQPPSRFNALPQDSRKPSVTEISDIYLQVYTFP